MSEKPNKDELIRDIEFIKNTFKENKKAPLIEYWAYISWAIVILVASIITWTVGFDSQKETLLYVGIPAIIVGGLLEFLGWLLYVKRTKTAFLTKRFKGLLAIAFPAIFIFSIMFYTLMDNPSFNSAAVLLMTMGLIPIIYGAFSFMELFIEGFLLFIVGMIFYFIGFSGTAAFITLDILVVCVFIITGIHCRKLEQKYE